MLCFVGFMVSVGGFTLGFVVDILVLVWVLCVFCCSLTYFVFWWLWRQLIVLRSFCVELTGLCWNGGFFGLLFVQVLGLLLMVLGC